jgi:hypothetical protein
MNWKTVLIVNLMFGSALSMVVAQTVTVGFEDQERGKAPKGFSTELTGKGEPGTWIVDFDKQDQLRGNFLAQTNMDRTSYRFPVCVYDAISAKSVDVSVRFKPVKGKEDQAAGIVWRYKDKNNYYIVRANALEGNVVLYKVENGKRTDLPLKGKERTYGMKTDVRTGAWGTLRVVAGGDSFEVYCNEKKLYDVEDTTFPEAGKIGLWTKADSYTLFDDLSITVVK